ncbi:hypothetical protein BAUCODRAFT_128249 [Baudoinia panamericana UAMH 10762]|uniref:Uncharacterized protein n=1 Tax=Baudoinia panamericana (strain UAMH 10762) TaxID=717646 RepID=M2NQH3_BAUPA|nr:uncharacterized protein BAUCODRAFT_128249 [Baudoinia panamericana UAMH 10762]EMD01301.1 hypothetical protein BAUCODRAFT_128249 [Baudoinia panamericana UAMH 10762]
MTLLTPPQLQRGKRYGLAYYEELYGEQNADEAFDRFPDECEDDSSSGDDESNIKTKTSGSPAIGRTTGFFKPYAGSINGTGGQISKRGNEGNNPNTDKERQSQYIIAPSINRKHSIVVSPSKKLKSKRFGLFGNSLSVAPAQLDPEPSQPNDMSDTLWAGEYEQVGPSHTTHQETQATVFEALHGDVITESTTLEEEIDLPTTAHFQAAMRSLKKSGPELLATAMQPAAMAMETAGSDADTGDHAPLTPISGDEGPVAVRERTMDKTGNEEDTGYQADNDETREELAEPRPKRIGRPRKTAGMRKGLAVTVKQSQLGRTRGATTKQILDEQAAKAAARPRTRLSAAAATLLKPSTRDKATARAATLKSMKVAKSRRGRPPKRLMRGPNITPYWRNWNGQTVRVKDGQGWVDMAGEMVDVTQYEKHF